MNMIEEKLADIIRENDAETAAKTIYAIMQELVKTEPSYTTANIYRSIDLWVDTVCEQQFG
jgi:Fe2+ or Zn2+ uptake regulation protein